MTFGEFIKSKRLERGYSLRNFCEQMNIDPSNWSKIERSRIKAPFTKLDDICLFLKLSEREQTELFDLAFISQTIVFAPITDEEIVKHLPLFCRAMRDKKKADRLIKLLRENL